MVQKGDARGQEELGIELAIQQGRNTHAPNLAARALANSDELRQELLAQCR